LLETKVTRLPSGPSHDMEVQLMSTRSEAAALLAAREENRPSGRRAACCSRPFSQAVLLEDHSRALTRDANHSA
jgi:hypothetical protein